MRILIFSPTVRAGTTQYTHCLANALAARGHDVLVVTSVGYEMASFQTQYEVLEVVDRHRPRPGALFNFLRRVRQWKPDVIHFQGAQHPTTYLGLSHLLSLVSRAPHVYTPQDVLPHYKRPNQIKALGALYRRMAHIFFNAQQNIDSVKELIGFKTDRLTVLPLADLTAFVRETVTPAPPDLPEQAKVVLFFGQLQARKGIGTLIDVFPKVLEQAPEAHLYIAGEAQIDLAPLRASIETLGIKDSVTIQDGYVSFEDMAGLFNRADLVVLPYESGWNSGVLISALGFGKPVVVTRVGGLDEVVVEGECGLIVPPMEPQALGNAIGRAITDDALIEAFREGVPKAAARYSWEEIAARTEEVYARVCA
jgi:glycosyltransferase involved in cell wall biosynthesis